MTIAISIEKNFNCSDDAILDYNYIIFFINFIYIYQIYNKAIPLQQGVQNLKNINCFNFYFKSHSKKNKKLYKFCQINLKMRIYF